MDTFFTILKKSLVATVFVIFTFVGTYVPQTWNEVETAHAWKATLPAQIMQNVNLIKTNIATTASWALNKISTALTQSLWLKEYTLDGIAWALAKGIVSTMVNSLISWINSGFKGSPAFIGDLSDYLQSASNVAMTNFIKDLGAIGSYICDPFKLDVQIAVHTQYLRASADGGNGQQAPTCKLSNLSTNLSTFLSGVQGSFTQGSKNGWSDWIDVTSKPDEYTPYGATLAAQAGAKIRILNTKNEEKSVADWGQGFLSGKMCQGVSGSSQPICSIVKPGKVIVESLNAHMDSGRESLIAADEIDEIIAALLGQLAQKVFTGAAGLLGLSGGTGHTYTGYTGGSYLNNTVSSSNAITQTNISGSLSGMQNALTLQQQYNAMANPSGSYVTQLSAFSVDPNQTATDRGIASQFLSDAATIYSNTNVTIPQLQQMISSYQTSAPAVQTQILNNFSRMTLYTQQDVNNTKTSWDSLLSNASTGGPLSTSYATELANMKADRNTQDQYNIMATNYLGQLTTFANNSGNDPQKIIQAQSAISDANLIISNTSADIPVLDGYIAILSSLNSSLTQKDSAVTAYNAMTLYTNGNITASKSAWDTILQPVNYSGDITRVTSALTLQNNYNNLADQAVIDYTNFLAQVSASSTYSNPTKVNTANTQLANANAVVTKTIADANTLTAILNDLNNASVPDAQKTARVNQFYTMTLYTQTDYNNSQSAWTPSITFP